MKKFERQFNRSIRREDSVEIKLMIDRKNICKEMRMSDTGELFGVARVKVR